MLIFLFSVALFVVALCAIFIAVADDALSREKVFPSIFLVGFFITALASLAYLFTSPSPTCAEQISSDHAKHYSAEELVQLIDTACNINK